jgi:DNA-directed RNA polymerase subunit M/transcription elongation factor TFIIS
MHRSFIVVAKIFAGLTQPEMKRQQKPLIRGTKMVCPRCKKEHNVLHFVPLLQIEEFAEDTTPIVKCPSCKWLFAPSFRASEVF